MDVNDVVGIIVENTDMNKENAKKRVDALVSKIKENEKYAGISEDDIYAIAYTTFKNKFDVSIDETGEVVEGLLIGIGENSNQWMEFTAKKRFKEDPKKAVTEGYVSADGNTLLDFREYVDKNKQHENKNKGKPIKNEPKLYFIVDNEVKEIVCQVKTPLTIGAVYNVTVQKNRYGRKFEVTNILSPQELWDVIEDAPSYGFSVCDINEAQNAELYSNIMVAGFVEKVFVTGNGYGVSLTDDSAREALVCFVNDPSLLEMMDNIFTSHEIVVYGKVGKNKDGETIINVYGAYINPRNSDFTQIANEFEGMV